MHVFAPVLVLLALDLIRVDRDYKLYNPRTAALLIIM